MRTWRRCARGSAWCAPRPPQRPQRRLIPPQPHKDAVPEYKVRRKREARTYRHRFDEAARDAVASIFAAQIDRFAYSF